MRTPALVTALALSLSVALVSAPADAKKRSAGERIEMKDDNEWIKVSGTAVAPTDDSFVLDYGKGAITVEVDDWDSYGEARALMDGDKVTVYGDIDDDFFEARTIEAASVYVENLNTWLTANSADEEDGRSWTAADPTLASETTVWGQVEKVSPALAEFTVDIGAVEVVVETDELGYDPLDDRGFQQLDAGDRVSVTGELDVDFLEGQRLEADRITTLWESDRASQAAR